MNNPDNTYSTPRVDALMAKWDDDGATRGSAFIELRDLARELEHLAATTQASTAQAEVKVERNRVWIVKGNQSFRLAYVPDEGDDPAEMQAYASNLRSAISIFTPCVKSVEQEAATSSPDAQAAPTDISRRLRDCIAQNVVPFPADVLAAADEIERYYGGMMAWKRTAEAKDADAKAAADVRDALRLASDALNTCQQGGYVDVDGDFVRTFRFDAAKVGAAVLALRSAGDTGGQS